jgi:hypothetical protein
MLSLEEIHRIARSAQDQHKASMALALLTITKALAEHIVAQGAAQAPTRFKPGDLALLRTDGCDREVVVCCRHDDGNDDGPRLVVRVLKPKQGSPDILTVSEWSDALRFQNDGIYTGVGRLHDDSFVQPVYADSDVDARKVLAERWPDAEIFALFLGALTEL